MNLYAFELGRKKELCFAELITVLGEENLTEKGHDTALFKVLSTNLQQLQNRLGGTIKIIEIFDELPFPSQKSEILRSIQICLEKHFKERSGKIPFSISILNFKNPRETNIKELLNFSKKILKSLGLNSRFVNKNFTSPPPSTIYKAKILEKGIDINIIKGREKIFIGKTVAIQNIDAYSKRDYEKPRRDPKAGMMPPKLAQIMINLAGQEAKTIYDPFCGTGTILMEGLLMGKNVIGSDIDQKMVEASKINCEWLLSFPQSHPPQEGKRESIISPKIFQRDARFITKKCLPEKIDAIVTEGYLGPPVTAPPSLQEREKIFRELANLHINWLRAVHSILSKGSKIIMCVGAFRTQKEIQHLPRFADIAKESGCKILQTFTYDRPNQIVVRDIKVLQKI